MNLTIKKSKIKNKKSTTKDYINSFDKIELQKPFLKWVGGKNKLLIQILSKIPKKIEINAPKIIELRGEIFFRLKDFENINKQIEEIIITHNTISKKEAKKRTIKLLNEVGLNDISSRPKIYPYELSFENS